MSVAPTHDAAAEGGGGEKLVSQRSRSAEEDKDAAVCVGSVLVMLTDSAEEEMAMYQPTGGGAASGAGRSCATAQREHEHSFVAVLAPSTEAALDLLANQPPGTYLLAKEKDLAITAYIKFRRAVRVATLVKSKVMKRLEHPFDWSKSRQPAPGVEAIPTLTPVHRMCLSLEAYLHLERCWKRFLPQVQAIVFELCCEQQVEEDVRLEDWTPTMFPSPSSASCSVILMPNVCGFYLLVTSERRDAGSASLAAVPVRQVEFDFDKFVLTVADGTLKPAAFMLSTYFSAKRTFEADFTFSAIRDNFLSPGQVALKETAVNPTAAQPFSFPNCIELSSSDPELALLGAAQAVCGAVIPHEPLPDTFLTVICDMHTHFSKTKLSAGDSDECLTVAQKPTSWPAQKMKMAAHVIPVILELLMASATFSEANDPEIHGVSRSTEAAKRKTQLLAQFSRVMRFDLLYMAMRSDDSVICRLTHQVFQFIGAQEHLPGEFIELVRDLAALFPLFLRLFLQNYGTTMLWKALHSSAQVAPAAIDPQKSRRSLPILVTSPDVGKLLQKSGGRKGSLLGFGLKASAKSGKSLLTSVAQAKSALPNSKPLALFRLSPLSVQLELGMQLREGQFVVPARWSDDMVCLSHTFCGCFEQDSSNGYAGQCPSLCGVLSGQNRAKAPTCARKFSNQTSKMSMYELVLQLALHFLFNKTLCSTWDRDVALLLRLDDMYEKFFSKILHLVERRIQTEDPVLKSALVCRIRVVVACVSELFRLEVQRRKDMTIVLGEKRYLSLFRIFRAKIREFNEALTDECSNAADHEGAEAESGDDITALDTISFAALTDIFQWIPKALLDEWIVNALEDLLQTFQELHNAVKASKPASETRQQRYAGYTLQILQVFRVILERVSDPDIQTLLVIVLGSRSSIVPLLRFVLSSQAISLGTSDPHECRIQQDVLLFLLVFAKLYLALPTRNAWSLSNSPVHDDSSEEDAERLKQKKDELLVTLLSPDFSAKDDEQTLWDFVLELLVPTGKISGDTSVSMSGASPCMFGVAAAFRSTDSAPELLTPDRRDYFNVLEAFLLLQQLIYSAQVPENKDTSVDHEDCIIAHLHCIEQYSDRIATNTNQEAKQLVLRVIELHLRCLIALASRRSQFPRVQKAFDNRDVLPWMIRRLQCHVQVQDNVSPSSAVVVSDTAAVADGVDDMSVCLPPLKLPGLALLDVCGSSERSPEEKLLGSQLNFSHLPSGAPQSVTTKRVKRTAGAHDQDILVAEPVLHTLMLVLVASFVVVDPNLALDDTVCLRVSVAGQEPLGKAELSDLLWSLQQHVATVELDQRCFECVILELDTLQTFGGACRAAAIRLLLRLLCPNRFDCNLYTSPRQDDATESQSQEPSATEGASSREQGAWEYIAKGAFATVYRSQPALPGSAPVAIKLLGHQKRAGELCPVSGLYNEVLVLKKLRGELAATQILDFGNHHAEKSFEVVMEYCPCSLTEWRASFTRAEAAGVTKVPFRSCLLLVLRAFDEICRCLARIHRADVCHFDIKGDNILVRTSAAELTRRLLQGRSEDIKAHPTSEHGPSGCMCFADFGESMVVDADSSPPARRSTFSSFSSAYSPHTKPPALQKPRVKSISLSRTRGTEAIKSPEVLGIKGNDDAKVKVTLASDVWSMGCLLYELVAQELLFEKDDWAGLYAHVVVAQHDSVLRTDHEEKMLAALSPTNDHEIGVVLHLIALCNNILCRTPSARPTLKTISTKMSALVDEVLQLPMAPEDEVFARELLSPVPRSDASHSAVTTASWSPPRQPFCRTPYVNTLASDQLLSSDAPAMTVPVRLFRNFFVLADVARKSGKQMVTSSVGSGAGPGSSEAMAMTAFEAQHEARFVHFVYVAWADNSSINVRPQGSASRTSAVLLRELHEDAHRTCLVLDPELQPQAGGCVALPPGTRLFQQLVQHTPQLFPVFQRRLREEAGNIAFLVLGGDAAATSALHDALTALLLFFLQRSLAMSTLEALSWLSRDCAQFLEYPRPEFLQHLSAFTSVQLGSRSSAALGTQSGSRQTLQCTCGTSVLCVESSAVEDALAGQRCTCRPLLEDEDADRARGEADAVCSSCPCFHPFPAATSNSDVPAQDEDDEDVVGPTAVLDGAEERLVRPFESRSRQGEDATWVSVSARSVGREDGVACLWAPLLSPSPSPTSIRSARGEGVGKISSRLEKLKRRASRAAGDISSRSHRQHSGKLDKEPSASVLGSDVHAATSRARLLQGLRLRGQHASWYLYECASCRLPVCAVLHAESGDRVALPVVPARRAPCDQGR